MKQISSTLKTGCGSRFDKQFDIGIYIVAIYGNNNIEFGFRPGIEKRKR